MLNQEFINKVERILKNREQLFQGTVNNVDPVQILIASTNQIVNAIALNTISKNENVAVFLDLDTRLYYCFSLDVNTQTETRVINEGSTNNTIFSRRRRRDRVEEEVGVFPFRFYTGEILNIDVYGGENVVANIAEFLPTRRLGMTFVDANNLIITYTLSNNEFRFLNVSTGNTVAEAFPPLIDNNNIVPRFRIYDFVEIPASTTTTSTSLGHLLTGFSTSTNRDSDSIETGDASPFDGVCGSITFSDDFHDFVFITSGNILPWYPYVILPQPGSGTSVVTNRYEQIQSGADYSGYTLYETIDTTNRTQTGTCPTFSNLPFLGEDVFSSLTHVGSRVENIVREQRRIDNQMSFGATLEVGNFVDKERSDTINEQYTNNTRRQIDAITPCWFYYRGALRGWGVPFFGSVPIVDCSVKAPPGSTFFNSDQEIVYNSSPPELEPTTTVTSTTRSIKDNETFIKDNVKDVYNVHKNKDINFVVSRNERTNFFIEDINFTAIDGVITGNSTRSIENDFVRTINTQVETCVDGNDATFSMYYRIEAENPETEKLKFDFFASGNIGFFDPPSSTIRSGTNAVKAPTTASVIIEDSGSTIDVDSDSWVISPIIDTPITEGQTSVTYNVSGFRSFLALSEVEFVSSWQTEPTSFVNIEPVAEVDAIWTSLVGSEVIFSDGVANYIGTITSINTSETTSSISIGNTTTPLKRRRLNSVTIGSITPTTNEFLYDGIFPTNNLVYFLCITDNFKHFFNIGGDYSVYVWTEKVFIDKDPQAVVRYSLVGNKFQITPIPNKAQYLLGELPPTIPDLDASNVAFYPF